MSFIRKILILIAGIPLSTGVVLGECDCSTEASLVGRPDIEFVGTVVAVRGKHEGWIYPGFLFQVNKSINFPSTVPITTETRVKDREFSDDLVVVDTDTKNNDCHVRFRVGERYLIKAKRIRIASRAEGKIKRGEIAERWFSSDCWASKLKDGSPEIKSEQKTASHIE